MAAFTLAKVVALVAVSMAAMCGAAPQGGSPPDCARTYTVQPGDWCDKISAEQNSSSYQLAQANQGVINADCSNLWVGQVICLGLTGSDCTDTVVVEAGGDCTAIAAAAGITYEKVRENNPNVDEACTNIYPGEVLCVAA